MPSCAASSRPTRSPRSARRSTRSMPRASRTAAASATAISSTTSRRGADGTPLVRMVQWPSYHQPALDAVRLDPRFAALLEPLIGARPQADHQPDPLEGAGRRRRFRLAPGFALPPARARPIATSAPPTSRPASRSIRTRRNPAGCVHAAKPHSGDLDLDTPTEVLGKAMQDAALERAGLSAGDADRARARARRSRFVEPLSRPRLGHQSLGPPAALLHQRLCPRRGLRPRRMGVPRRPAGAARAPSRRWSITRRCASATFGSPLPRGEGLGRGFEFEISAQHRSPAGRARAKPACASG